MKNKKAIYVVIGVLVVLNVVFWVWAFEREDELLEVVYFDVGQGDSIFIELDDYQILIDGGPDLTILEKLGQEMAPYDRTLDLVVLTHPDHDHLFGLLEVLKRYEVKNILWTGVLKDTAEYQRWRDLIKKEEANIIIAEGGQEINLPRSDLGKLKIYYPFESVEGKEVKDVNNTSVVMELVYGGISFLFIGDISSKIEKELDVDSDILKVGHHGSKTSTSLGFLESVSPELAVISVGENQWGHPAPEVLQRLEEFGIKVLITNELNDIRIVSDGNNFTIK